jgi:hypothetical protein
MITIYLLSELRSHRKVANKPVKSDTIASTIAGLCMDSVWIVTVSLMLTGII